MGVDLNTYDQAQLDEIVLKRNTRPRKTLGYNTPGSYAGGDHRCHDPMNLPRLLANGSHDPRQAVLTLHKVFLTRSGRQPSRNLEPDNATSPTFLPLYEAKMIHHFDHRFATYEPDGRIRNTTLSEHQDVTFAPMPRYWVEAEEVHDRLVRRDSEGKESWSWREQWLLGFRDITNATNERTAIFSLTPRVAVGNNLPLMLPEEPSFETSLLLLSVATSHVFDFVARQAVGGSHMNFYIVKQLPVPSPEQVSGTNVNWVLERARLLACPGLDDAKVLGQLGTVETWSEYSRLRAKAELSAYFMEIYGLGEHDAEYVLDSFGTQSRREAQLYGEHLTKRIVVEALQERAWSN